MRSATAPIILMMMAFFYILCDAAPLEATLPGIMPENLTSTDTGISMVAPSEDPNNINNVPNLNKDVWKNKQRCYDADASEKWGDMGGKYSQFVNETVYNLTDIIGTYASNVGFKKDDTVCGNLSNPTKDSIIFADHCA